MRTIKDIKSEFRADWKEKYINPPEYWKIEEMQKFLDENYIRKSDLRKLAIERVKEYLDGLSGYVILIEVSDYLCVWKKISGHENISNVSNVTGRVEELVEFFNIEMEDLK